LITEVETINTADRARCSCKAAGQSPWAHAWAAA